MPSSIERESESDRFSDALPCETVCSFYTLAVSLCISAQLRIRPLLFAYHPYARYPCHPISALTWYDDAQITTTSDRLEPGTHDAIEGFYNVPKFNSQIIFFRNTFS